MQNKLPGPLNRLFSRGEDMVAGALAHGDAIELKQNDAESIGEDLDAARALDIAFKAARTGKKNAFSEQRTANKNALAFIVKARDVLKPHLGAKPSELWVEAGFTSSSIKLPDSIAARLALLIDRYRVYKKVVGVDSEFVLVATVADTESNLNTFTSGQVVRVRVSGRE